MKLYLVMDAICWLVLLIAVWMGDIFMLKITITLVVVYLLLQTVYTYRVQRDVSAMFIEMGRSRVHPCGSDHRDN